VLDADNPNPSQPYGWMEAGLAWRGDFPDPDIIREGSTYYAYSTNAAGRYMPVLMSTDLVTWTSPPRYTGASARWEGGGDPHLDPSIPVEIRQAGLNDGDTWNLNDALVKPPIWGAAPRSRAAGCGRKAAGSFGLDGSRTPCSMALATSFLATPRADPIGSSTTGPLSPASSTTTSTTRPTTTTSTTVPPAVPRWTKTEMWGPGVIKIGHRFYAYSAVAVARPSNVEYGRFCLTVARSSSPRGPFRDISGSQPILCDVDPGGSIDPYPFQDPKTGQRWLYWKATGNGGSPGHPSYPSALKAIRLSPEGLPVGGITTLLTTQPHSWEGFSIENPSMIYWKNKYWLFYSGNKFVLYANGRSPYATGYAVCDSPSGPCVRTTGVPLLASNAAEVGPGGGSPIVDGRGHLRLAIHYFWPGDQRDGGTPRRLKVLTISRLTPTTLTVVR